MRTINLPIIILEDSCVIDSDIDTEASIDNNTESKTSINNLENCEENRESVECDIPRQYAGSGKGLFKRILKGIDEFHLKNFLQTKALGRCILKDYNKNSTLSRSSRSDLCDLIINHFLDESV